MEFKNHTDNTGAVVPASEQFRMIFLTSDEIMAAQQAVKNAAISAMQSGAFDNDMAEESVKMIESLQSWEPSRRTTAERARTFARLLRYGGPSLLDDQLSTTALRLATELESEAEVRDAMRDLIGMSPEDFIDEV